MFVYTYTHIYTYTFIYIYLCISILIHLYIYICIYTGGKLEEEVVMFTILDIVAKAGFTFQ